MRHLAERIADLAAKEAGGDWVWCEIVLDEEGFGGLRTLLRVEGPRTNGVPTIAADAVVISPTAFFFAAGSSRRSCGAVVGVVSRVPCDST